MKRKLSVILENDLQELRVLTELLQSFLRPYGMPGTTLYALELSLEEIFVNIVSYAYEDGERHPVHFEVEVDSDMIGMAFIDEGRPFNPLAVENSRPKPPSEHDVGGLGIGFVRHMRDMMEYQRQGARNVLRLWFQRDASVFGPQNASGTTPAS